MIWVKIPSDRVMHDVSCNESPWGSEEQLIPEIVEWLDSRLSEDGWDYEVFVGNVEFGISDMNTALLFKLMWA